MAVVNRNRVADAKPKTRRPIDKGPMSHHDLCIRAERWLLNSCRCSFVLRDLTTIAMERPDAIGWREGQSHLIECKVSRADFLADGKKHYRRRQGAGMGMYRYMMCPEDLIRPGELSAGWGLLYCTPKSVRVVLSPLPQDEWNKQNEADMMCSALRRLHQLGYLKKIYGTNSKEPAHDQR